MAGKNSAELFLVPHGQDFTYVESCEVQRSDNFVYRNCNHEKKPLSPIMEKEYDMKVVAVKNIDEALQYFTQDNGKQN